MSRIVLANALAIPAAGTTTTTPVKGLAEIGDITGYLNFDYGSGGTSLDVYLQTSFDGTNWYDIIHWPQYTTADAVDILSVSSAGDLTTAPTEGDAALAAGTVQSGMLGDQLRLKLVVVGTYAASTLTVVAEARADSGDSGIVAIAGADTSEKNASVSVANSTTALISATTRKSRTTLIKNTGDRVVFLGFGASATTSMFPLNVGETLRTRYTGAINGITASGTGTCFVLAEAR